MSANTKKLAERLSAILVDLHSGQRLSSHSLAEKYGVSLKTIKRDLGQRLDNLPWLEAGPQFYRLDTQKMQHTNLETLTRFCRFAAIKELFPPIDQAFLDNLLKDHILVKGLKYENIQGLKQQFLQLEQAIDSCHMVYFDYCKINEKQAKPYTIAPYGLVNKNGIWYVIGLDQGKEKTYNFKQISNVKILTTTFECNQDLKEKLRHSDSLYHGNQIQQITLKVNHNIAPYFRRQAQFPNQEIIETLANGDLIIECRDINPVEVLPMVKYWLPHITIISPRSLQQDIKDMLKQYLQAS